MTIQIDLRKKTAIVTGGGRGLGRVIAHTLADAGADVVITARTDSQINAVADEIREKGRRSLAVRTDVTDAGQIQNMVKKTIETMGGIDILVNNAGGQSQGQPLQDCPESLWDEIINANLKGVFLCTKEVGKVMIAQQHGKIINITSAGGLVGGPKNASYHAAKSGVISFTKSMGLEWIRYNIQVNAVASGILDAGATEKLDQRSQDIFKKAIPTKRFGLPSEIAPMVAFLASDYSSYMVGACVVIDGGLVAI
jgi:3-oxoacyl-[acyl-carrier protein] reductase